MIRFTFLYICKLGQFFPRFPRTRVNPLSVIPSPWLLLSLMWTLQPSSWGAVSLEPVSLSACSSAWILDTEVESKVTSHSSAARPRRNTHWFRAGLNVYRSLAESPPDEPIRSSWKQGCTPDSMTERADCLPQPEATPALRQPLHWQALIHCALHLNPTGYKF